MAKAQATAVLQASAEAADLPAPLARAVVDAVGVAEPVDAAGPAVKAPAAALAAEGRAAP